MEAQHVQRVADLNKDKIVVGHAVYNVFKVRFLYLNRLFHALNVVYRYSYYHSLDHSHGDTQVLA